MSNFNVVRGENGQIRFTLNNVKDFEVGGVAKVTGSATFSVGNTGQATNETVLQMGATKDAATILEVDDDLNNIEFYGSDLEAKFNSHTDKQYNVQWSAKDSTLDSTKGNGSLLINTHEKSENNTFKLGDAKSEQALFSDSSVDNVVVDNGKNNTFISSEKGSNYFETSETSKGATILAGNGNSTFIVNGDNGLVVAGKGDDLFITGDKAQSNVLMGMDGADRFSDYGDGNLIIGGAGVDSLDSNGQNGLANLGNGEDYNLHIGSGAENNAIFTGEKLVASDLTSYNYQEFLNNYLDKNGMSMKEFQEKANLGPNASAYDIIAALKGQV